MNAQFDPPHERLAFPIRFPGEATYDQIWPEPVPRVVAALATLLDKPASEFARRIAGWEGPPLADALPLRAAGGIHALHLSNTAHELAPIYADAEDINDAAIVAGGGEEDERGVEVAHGVVQRAGVAEEAADAVVRGASLVLHVEAPRERQHLAEGGERVVDASGEQEHVAAAGWNTWSGLVSTRPDAELDLAELEELLARVEREIGKAPNRVRYCMNGFVIAVGSAVKPLLARAKASAKKLGKVEVDVGETACKVPDALGMLAKIESTGRVGKKRATMKC